MAAILTLKEKALNFGSSERSMMHAAIKEYNSLVVRRSNSLAEFQLNTNGRTSVESVLSRFADDAVNSTYGMVWNAVDIPFTITSSTEPDRDFTELAKILATVLEQRKTGFKSSLRHILKCYLEYGSGWMYVFNDGDGNIVHRVFSVMEVARSLDIFNRPEVVVLDRGDDAFTLVHRKNHKEFHVTHKNTTSDNASNDASSGTIPYSPIIELSLTGNYNDKYPLGYGLKAISDLKRYDDIIHSLNEASGAGLRPIPFMSSGVNMANKADSRARANAGQILIDSAIGDKIFPVGYIPAPINSVDAWRLFELASVNIRESFNFINRLLTIKDNAQMTATEAQIRSQSDLSQIRDTIEVIFSFLNDTHRAQLFILKDHELFKDWKDIDPNDLNFFHTSIFKKESDAQKIMEINQGLDIGMKAVQFGAMATQSGIGDVIDSRTVLRDVAKTTNIALSSEKQNLNSTLASLLQNVTQNINQ